MRTRGMLTIACLFSALAADVVENTPGPGEQSAQDKAQLEAQASLSKLNGIIQALSPNIGSARSLSQDNHLGDLIQSVVSNIPSLGGGSFNPLGNMGGSLGSNLLGGSSSGLLGRSGLGGSLFGGSDLGCSLLGVSGFASNIFGGNSGEGNGMTEILDVLGSDTPFSTGAFLLDTKDATVPASLDNMLKTTDLTPEESAMLLVTAYSIALASGMCFIVATGLLTGSDSGRLLAGSLGLITGPYGWGLTVLQTWNNSLSSRSSAKENAKLWTSTLTQAAERIGSFETGALKQELVGLRGQLGDILKHMSAAQSRFL